jgi:magnesium transporter
MIKRFQLADGALTASDALDAPVQLWVSPDPRERAALRERFRLDEHTLSSALDPDEVARMELEPERLLLIWKRPKNYSGAASFFFDVASVGLLLLPQGLVVIAAEEIALVAPGARPTIGLRSPLDVLLALLSGTIHHYLEHLKVIKMIAREVQQKINTSLENEHLIQMFNLSESLIYYVNAIDANGTVLSRLRVHAERDQLPSAALALIDDLIIENNQCCKQAEIYSGVLSGLMDARGSLVNNNMNILLRNLTIINVVFLPLSLIAGIGGMSEYSMMTRGLPWPFSYGLLIISMGLVGWLTAVLLKRMSVGGGRPAGGRRLGRRGGP